MKTTWFLTQSIKVPDTAICSNAYVDAVTTELEGQDLDGTADSGTLAVRFRLSVYDAFTGGTGVNNFCNRTMR